MEKFKDVEIEGVEYRIGVFTPMVGSMIMNQMPAIQIKEDVYMSVLRNCLGVIAVLKEVHGQKQPLKLYSKLEDKWLLEEITNPAVLASLMAETVSFNLQPFIGGSGKLKPIEPSTESSIPQSSTQIG
jgi:hypothetical protein